MVNLHICNAYKPPQYECLRTSKHPPPIPAIVAEYINSQRTMWDYSKNDSTVETLTNLIDQTQICCLYIIIVNKLALFTRPNGKKTRLKIFDLYQWTISND